mmetsp:Transcript_28307/g.79209  ORF Transcript_28307/g.79209 Transcript_28307/m.79209 type:complete len:191 (-) Transcript_28307:299-871(-)
MALPSNKKLAAGTIGAVLAARCAVLLSGCDDAAVVDAEPNVALAGLAEEVMVQRAHGTCVGPPRSPLRWGSDVGTADRICCFNRHYAEYGGYFQTTTFFDDQRSVETTVFYDSITGHPLFEAPIGRSFDEFYTESVQHGWPSFRDAEVRSDFVRVLEDGEVASVNGTHLGHNLPDSKGNRYCINIVSVAG